MMRRCIGLFAALLLALPLLLYAGCAVEPPAAPDAAPRDAFPRISYTHYASGGTSEQYEAVILFEQSNATFTAYQVAFYSCTCRDSQSNYLSVAYVELLNTRERADDAAIRALTFGENRGLWGDSNPNYYIPAYTEAYYDEHFVQKLVKTRKAEYDAWEGYGTQLSAVDPDAITGATVSSSNITSMLRSLFAYHAKKYYAD